MSNSTSARQIWPDGAPRHQHLLDIFREAVGRDPDTARIVFRDRGWSHGDINRWSSAIAEAIADRLGEGANFRICLLVGRGPGLLAGMLGILKAGCIFVPIDPAHPAERIKAILSDAAPELILVDEATVLSGWFGLSTDRLLEIGLSEQAETQQPCRQARSDGADPAYILYTSGSTGRPKGVVCNHLGICNLVHDRLSDTSLTPTARILLTTSISFDPAIYNIFLALESGATLIIADEQTATSGAALADLMRRQAINFIDMTPSLLAAIPADRLPDLEFVSLGGEPCQQGLIDAWAPRVALHNCYGPTEASVEVTRWRWSVGQPGNRIGAPIRNVRLRIVDETDASAEEGELWIGGPMVAIGYLGLPELTTQRFVTCPESGLRFYRSGDHVRRIGIDLYEFLGRMDDQIKITGVRIEPEEVRSAIEAISGVLQAAVVVERSDRGAALVSYYRASPAAPDCAAILDALSRRLPPAMMPARLIQVEVMPVLASGKTDIDKLKRQAGSASVPSGAGAQSEVARALTRLWCKILNLADVKLSDNFFELGGDSLRLTQLIFAVNKTYRAGLTPAAYRALEDLGALIAYVEAAMARCARPPGSVAQPDFQGEKRP